jgi:hypothetical protein
MESGLYPRLLPQPTKAQIGRQMTFYVTPHTLPGASSAELDMQLISQQGRGVQPISGRKGHRRNGYRFPHCPRQCDHSGRGTGPLVLGFGRKKNSSRRGGNVGNAVAFSKGGGPRWETGAGAIKSRIAGLIK